MSAWRNAPRGLRPQPEPGVVHRMANADSFELGRLPATGRLEPFVDHLWWVRWDLTGRPAVPSQVLPFPSVHLTVEDGRPAPGLPEPEVRHGHRLPAVLLHGVPTRDFSIELSGSGWVAGVRFRPGGWSAFTGTDVASLTGRVIAATGPAAELGQRALSCPDLGQRLATLHDGLEALAPHPDPDYARLSRLIDAMRTDPSLRVEDLPKLSGWSLRTLQRRFRSQVGASPKWVLRRYRLIDAAYAIETDPGADLAGVSAAHGWYDQAHFTNDFRDTVGTTPGSYASRAAGPVSSSGRPSRRPRASTG